MSRNYTVTGGAGFVGATVVRRLLERGDGVTVLDSGEAAGFDNLDGLRERLRVVTGDVRDQTRLEDALDGAEAIVHLAARVSVPRSIDDPLDNYAANVDGTVRLLETARHRRVGRFVFVSSNATIGGHQPPMQEGLTPRAVSPYGAAKVAGEAYVYAYGRAYGLDAVSLRLSNVYGPWSAHKTSAVAAFIKAYLAGGPLVIRGSGEQTRDLVHVDDVAAAVITALDAPPDAIGGEVFQIGSGEETSLNQLAAILFEVGGRAVPIERQPPSAGDVARNFSDISKARRVLGWTPQVSLRDGIAATLDWFRARRRD
ncbi:MAG: NAD-dependent epimerase/dehydratase family protein [Chloroflexota bacterium]|nr:NAD-dependent epimerase/dehydratase family protein [Chloroflexota bacterium]